MAGKTRRPGELPPLPAVNPAPPFPPAASAEPVPPAAGLTPPAAPAPATPAPAPAATGRLRTDAPFSSTAPAAAVAVPAPTASATPISPPSPSGPMDAVIGTVIGDRYRIVERIGSGGMAAVYRAEHELLKKAVAIKLLLPELAVDQEMVARFEREAVAAARLDHPNCVAITDFGRTRQGRLFLVMELLDGRPLAEISGYGKRLPWERAVEIARQILRGLARAHEMGIVHRDLKASNIMLVSREGGRDIAKIIDFGIAKIFDGTAAGPHVETRAGVVFGTADFLAPERLLGKGDTDPRSDLYSVGIILYEMVTGGRPFHADDPYDIVKRALNEAPAPPSRVAPDADIPAALEQAILRALEKDPEKRYPAARDFLAVLDPIGRRPYSTTGYLAAKAASRPPESRPPGMADGATSSRPLDRRALALWAGFVLVPLVAIVLAIVFAVSGDDDSGSGGATALGGRKKGLPRAVAAGAPASPTDEVAKLVRQAGEGETVEIRQSAFDRLVALGYVDRVPWVEKLSRDLEQLPTCEQRREVVTQLRKLNDPKALPALEEAHKRSGNDCLRDDAARAIAALGGKSPATAAPAPTTAPKKPSTKPTARPATTPKKSGGGGHF